MLIQTRIRQMTMMGEWCTILQVCCAVIYFYLDQQKKFYIGRQLRADAEIQLTNNDRISGAKFLL